MGFTLGIFGAGGSIMTLPIMVYLFKLEPTVATTYSLFIVGITSMIGSIRNIQKGNIEKKVVLLFAIPASLTVIISRRYIITALPNVLIEAGNFAITKETVVMLLFGCLMLFSSISMLLRKDQNGTSEDKEKKMDYPILILIGSLIGLLTGLLGAGGGFLITPALVLFARLPIKTAIGTSLTVISINALIGFAGDIGKVEISWNLLITFSLMAIAGMLTGLYISNFISSKNLGKIFGIFIMVMSILILSEEIFNHIN